MRYSRIFTRIVVILAVAVSAMQLLPWQITYIWVSASSPFVSICSAIALRMVTPIMLAGVPLLILALMRGRWFCYYLCPMGFVVDYAGKLNRRHRSTFLRIPRIGPWIVMLSLGSAIFGFPLFLWLDPLAQLNGFFSVLTFTPLTWRDILSASGFCMIVVLTLCLPHVWCERICPLGSGLHMMRQLVKYFAGKLTAHCMLRVQSHASTPSWVGSGFERRAFLAVLAGAGVGWVLRSFRVRASGAVIRPPGAVDENQFGYLCVRCGNCVQVCPEHIILPDIGRTGLIGLVTPALDFSRGYCNEWCHECTRVCPTRAVQPLPIHIKRALSIGTAHIDPLSCLAWKDGKNCMICHEYCPYQAILTVQYKGVNCPKVDERVCRGCGACQNKCPALPVKAIVVQGIHQRMVPS